MTQSILDASVSPLRQRLIDDMHMRRFSRETQRNYIRDVGRFATSLGRPPHTATAEDLRPGLQASRSPSLVREVHTLNLMGKDPAAALRERMSKILALLRGGSKAERKTEEANQLRRYERRDLVRRLQARRDAN